MKKSQNPYLFTTEIEKVWFNDSNAISVSIRTNIVNCFYVHCYDLILVKLSIIFRESFWKDFEVYIYERYMALVKSRSFMSKHLP